MNAAAIDGYEEALRRSGVTWTTLTADEKDALDRHGFVVLAGVLDAAALARLRDAFEAAARSESAAPGGKQTGTRHPEDLLARAPAFDLLVAHPKVLAAVRHVLRRPFRIFLFAGRDPLPGFGLQGLHADWLPRTTDSDPYGVVSAIWALDDFTERNGATRVVPGSHRLPRPIPKSMQDPAARHPEQKVVVAKAGSVLVLNGHLWHSGRRNDGDGPRRAVQCQYVARDHVRPGSASIELPGRLPAEARRVLGG